MRRKPAGVRPVYQFLVYGERLVGRMSTDRKALASWRSFVRAAWHARTCRIVQVASLLPKESTNGK